MFQHFPISLELPTFADTIANLAQSKAAEQSQTSRKDSIPDPLQVLGHDSSLIVPILASTDLPSKGVREQDFDMITSSSSDKVIFIRAYTYSFVAHSI